MRVLAVDQAAGLWGAQLVLLRLAVPLAERGVELTLAAAPDSDFSVAWRAKGLPAIDLATVPVSSPRVNGTLSARSLASLAAGAGRSVGVLASLARSGGFDVLHGNGHAVHLSVALAGRRARIPSVLHLHEELPYRLGRSMRTAALALSSASIAVSDAVRQNVSPRARARVSVVPNGVDVSQFEVSAAVRAQMRTALRAQFDIADGDVLIVVVTRIDPVKRIEDVVAALRPIAYRPGWRALVVGDTSDFPDYQASMRTLIDRELGGKVVMAGRRDDVAAILLGSDVMLHTGLVEGMPLGILEAQAAGLAVVGYRVAGIPEVVLDGTTGLLAPPGDTTVLSGLLVGLLDDADVRKSLGDAGSLRARTLFGLDAQAQAYADLVGRIVDAARRR